MTYGDVEREWRETEDAFRPLIAEDVSLQGPLRSGRFVVEDVEQDRFTTTYNLRSLPPTCPCGLKERPGSCGWCED